MVESKKLAEFRISRKRLVDALLHISNISDRAAIALIVDREDENKEMGVSFSNIAKTETGDQFDLYASYPIFNMEMTCHRYFLKDSDEWPPYFIACDQRFIKAICTLPIVKTTSSNDDPVLDLVLYHVKDGDVEKSESVVFGNHHASVVSIIAHTDLEVSSKGTIIVKSDGTDMDEDYLRSYI